MSKIGSRRASRSHVPGLSYWIGANLIEARHAAGLTQKALGSLAGLSARRIQSIETRAVANVTVGTLEALGKALGMDVIEFFRKSDDFVKV